MQLFETAATGRPLYPWHSPAPLAMARAGMCLHTPSHAGKIRQNLESCRLWANLKLSPAILISRQCMRAARIIGFGDAARRLLRWSRAISHDGDPELADLALRSPSHSPHAHADMHTESPKRPRVHTVLRSRHAHDVCERATLASPLFAVEHDARRAEHWHAMPNADLSREKAEARLAALQWQE